MSKVVCECGTELLKSSLKAHLLTDKHKRLLAAIQKKSDTKPKITETAAKQTLTSAIKSRKARQEYRQLELEKVKKIIAEPIEGLSNLLNNYSYLSDDKYDNLIEELGSYLVGENQIKDDDIIYLIELLNNDYDEQTINEDIDNDTKEEIFETLRVYVLLIERRAISSHDILLDIPLKSSEAQDTLLDILQLQINLKRPYFSYMLNETFNDEPEKSFIMCYEEFKRLYLKYGNNIRKKFINNIFETLLGN